MPKGGSQTVATQLNPGAAAYVRQMRQAASGYAGLPGTPGSPAIAPNLPPEIAQAQQDYGNYAQAGNLGLGALTGQPGAQQQFMNPYLSQMNPLFDQLRQQSLQAVGSDATGAGAYGGSRQGVAQGVALGQVANSQAGFNYQGFQDAMQRAAQAANLGFGANERGAFLPQRYGQGQIGLLNTGLGPYGQTQTTTQQTDPWAQLLGLGLTAGGMYLGGPGGAAAGNQAGQQLFGGGGYK